MEHNRKKNATALILLIVTCLIVFIFGCDDSLQTTPGDLNATNLSASWSKAHRIIQDALMDNDPLVRSRAIEVVASTRQLKLMPQVQRLM